MMQSVLPDFTEASGRHLLVALSGGADSVALLCLLADARSPLGLTLSAAHVDHSIRGADSRADAAFCRLLCQSLNVPFYMETIDVPRIASENAEGLETAARRLRYQALERIRAEADADWIALAHHLDDQAETVLMHLLRGCGPDGIAGMTRLSGNLSRPLLGVPKSALIPYLEQRDQNWRTDSTNLEVFTPRNALRLHALPILEESYPQAARAIARYAEAAAIENRFMEGQAASFLQSHLEKGAYGMRLVSPETCDEAILRRAIRKLCGSETNHDKLDELANLCRRRRGRAEISASLMAERTPSAIYFLPRKAELPAPVPVRFDGDIEFGALGTLEIRPCGAIPDRTNPLRQVLRRNALQDAVLRTRRDGDRIRPLGGGDKLLSDYLTDRKIDRPLRSFLPLVAVGRHILWVVGAGISEDARLRTENDDAVSLEWHPRQNPNGSPIEK